MRTTGLCPSGDVVLHYRHFGAAGELPLVIVHGLSYFSWDWIEVAEALAGDANDAGGRREIAAMDMRGFGDSSCSPSQDYAVPAMARDIVALADLLGWPRFAILGHSMGGRNSLWCAAEFPTRVAGLVLGDYTPENAPAGSQRVARTVAATPDLFGSIDEAMQYHNAGPDQRPRFEAWLQRVAGGYRVKRDTYFRDQFRRALQSGQRAPLGVDLWGAVTRLKCPLKVIRGSRSDFFGEDSIAKYRARNCNALVVEIDAGHDIAVDNAEAVIRETRAFLESL